MVEWLLGLYSATYVSLPVSTNQIQQVVSKIIENQFILWTVVVLFILVIRWLTQPRNDMT